MASRRVCGGMAVRKIIHLDMDAFYASVEQRDNPELRGVPVAVGGGPGGRGVVAAASYEARKYGVRSAMPSSRAARLCPPLRFVRPRMSVYVAVSKEIRAIFEDVTDTIEPLSLDEAYLDVTENKLGLQSATEVAQYLRRRIRDELQLTSSAGVSHLKFVAKIASAYQKPDGLTVVPPGRVLEFIHPMPVEKLWGVGPSTARVLHSLGLRTIGDVARETPDRLAKRMGKRGLYLRRMAHGKDPRVVRARSGRKSRGSERTFAEDIVDVSVLEGVIEKHARRICTSGHGAKTVTLKLRYDDFSTITRSLSLDERTDDPLVVAAAGYKLLSKTEAGERPVRLLGLSLSNFAGRDEQRQLVLPFEE